jgi:hypothetical protein
MFLLWPNLSRSAPTRATFGDRLHQFLPLSRSLPLVDFLTGNKADRSYYEHLDPQGKAIPAAASMTGSRTPSPPYYPSL